MDVEQLSPLSVFRLRCRYFVQTTSAQDRNRPRLAILYPVTTSPVSAGVIRAASWPSFCFVFLTGRQLRLISRSATLISSAQYDNSLGKDNYRWCTRADSVSSSTQYQTPPTIFRLHRPSARPRGAERRPRGSRQRLDTARRLGRASVRSSAPPGR